MRVQTRLRSDNGDCSGTHGIAQASDFTCTFVESGELGAQVRGVARVCRHLCETTRDLTQGLCPTRRRVRHHCDVLALVTPVLGERDTRVDGRLTRSDWHVRCVGHESRTLHDWFLPVANLHREFGELRSGQLKSESELIMPNSRPSTLQPSGTIISIQRILRYGAPTSLPRSPQPT